MKIFIDSADLEEIKEALSLGIIDGITTNPSLIKRALEKKKKIDMNNYLERILKIAKGKPVSLEVIGTSYEEIIKETKFLYTRFNKISNNVYVKIPINTDLEENSKNKSFEALKAIKKLSKGKIPINCTLIFTPEQALLAGKAGAKIVSIFVGRVDDSIRKSLKIKFKKKDYFPADGIKKGKEIFKENGFVSGIDLLKKCVDLIKKEKLKTEILAASIRNSKQFREADLAGADIVTIPLSVLKELIKSSKTTEGMKDFKRDIIDEYKAIFQ